MPQVATQPKPSGAIHTERPPIRAYPGNVTYNNLIRRNKRKSILLIMAMSMLLVVLGGIIAGSTVAYAGGFEFEILFPSILIGALVAGVFAVITSLWSFYGGSNAILKMSGAVEVPREVDPQLHNVVEELAIAAGVPKPKVYLINDTALNAFATGRDPEHSAVAITVGLRQQLSRDELAGVMAHEISHIRHFDIRFAVLMATMVGLIVFACDAFWRILWYSGRGGRVSGRGGGKGGGGAGMIVILIIAILLAIIAPMLAMMIRLAFSRQREYLADAGAVELTRYPQGMISALEKLGRCKEPLEVANRATAHLYIVNPLKNALKGKGHELSSAFRTHPPLHDRIERLQALIE